MKRDRRTSAWLLTGIALVNLLGSTNARSAQTPAPSTPAPAPAAVVPPAAPGSDAQKVEEARARFQRALELAEDGDFDASLLELRKAYDLAPSFRILYNIGLVYQQLKEYAPAYDAFERYLQEGGNNVEPDRAEEVRRRIDRLKGRVGYLVISSNVPGAEVLVDDLHRAETPVVKPLRVDSGQRRVTVRLSGHPSETRVIELAGGETKTVTFDLRIATGPAASPPKSPVPWISWGVTGAIAAGAVVTGILALNAESSYDSQAATVGTNLGPAYDKLHTLAITTDALIGAAILGAGVSIYFSIRPPHVKPARTTGVRFAPGVIAGSF